MQKNFFQKNGPKKSGFFFENLAAPRDSASQDASGYHILPALGKI